ncbi:ZP domain-containing protein [Trichonephila clavipes]|nr:ZP domain-containing protein [Trichonephila clavipes]
MIGTTPVTATAPLPSCTMKIFQGEPDEGIIAENVKIGDLLSLVISIDFQDAYGLKVTNCLVRDGLNWGEQPLINNEGCPVDEDIMGPFDYVHNKTQARVTFQAHKFPYTSSVYYQCNVKMCLKNTGGCDDVVAAIRRIYHSCLDPNDFTVFNCIVKGHASLSPPSLRLRLCSRFTLLAT